MITDPIKALVGLEALAKAATPGPWEWVNPDDDAKRKEGEWSSSLRTVEHFGENKTEVIDGKSYTSFSLPKFILSAELDCGNNMDADAAFIAAANPSVILAAIEALKRPASPAPVDGERVERVARAAFDRQEWERVQDGQLEAEIWDDIDETAKEYWREFVKPVIAAIGER